MNYEVIETRLPEQLAALSLSVPEGLSFVPDNIDAATAKEAFIFGDNQQDIAKVFKKNNISVESIGGKATAFRSRKSADWFGPSILVSFSILSQNPEAVSVALNLISSYLYDYFKGSLSDKKVDMNLYVESKKGSVQKLQYKGDPEGLKELPAIIKAMKK